MADLHSGMNNRIYGRLLTDEEFTVRMHHITKMIREGTPVRYFTDKFNRIQVARGDQWWVLDDLAEVESKYNWRITDGNDS